MDPTRSDTVRILIIQGIEYNHILNELSKAHLILAYNEPVNESSEDSTKISDLSTRKISEKFAIIVVSAIHLSVQLAVLSLWSDSAILAQNSTHPSAFWRTQ
jgi:hypothetical protein